MKNRVYHYPERIKNYYLKYGTIKTFKKLLTYFSRKLILQPMVIYQITLSKEKVQAPQLPSDLSIEVKKSECEFDPIDFSTIVSYWNEVIKARQIRERFAKKARLWIVKVSGNIAGYGWTIRGDTIEPYFFPLSQNNVHLFDFEIFEPYRGRGINPILVRHILSIIQQKGVEHAFIETFCWNIPERRSLRKTPFWVIGKARKLQMFNKTIVLWDDLDCSRKITTNSNPLERNVK